MSFHIKYRPKTFKEVIGNKSTIKSLESLFNNHKSSSHVFLFHGASGCGKTTLARIIANELGCSEHDYTEVNAGNNRGIDTAREILKTVNYLPTQGDSKVILFDEVHQTTKDFQNALLKVLEDTPQHVYFILCTTDPQKLISTIRNRCVTYEVESLSDKGLGKLLDRVAEKEGKPLLKKVKKKLVDRSEGCARQGLILLEEILFMKEKDQLKAIKVFKTQEEQVINLCRAILAKEKWISISKLLKGITDDPESTRRAILGYMSAVMLSKENPHCMIAYMAFKDPFYNVGKAGLVFSCYKAISY